MNTNAQDADQAIRVLVHGATGRMGQAVLRLATAQPAYRLVGAVSQRVSQRVIDGIPQFSASELHGAPPFDVAIDFSLPGAFGGVPAPSLTLVLEDGTRFPLPTCPDPLPDLMPPLGELEDLLHVFLGLDVLQKFD